MENPEISKMSISEDHSEGMPEIEHQIQDEEANDPETTLHADNIQVPVQTPQSVSFMLRENKCINDLNIYPFACLSMTLAQMFGIFKFTSENDCRWMFVPVAFDLVLHLLSLAMYRRYPVQFRILGENNLKEAIDREYMLIYLKIAAIIVLASSFYTGNIIVVLILMCVTSVTRIAEKRNYRVMYISILKSSELFMMSLALLKLNSYPAISWNLVMISQLAGAWIIAVVSYVSLPVLIFLFIFKIFRRNLPLPFANLAYWLSTNMLLFSSAFIIFGVHSHVKGTEPFMSLNTAIGFLVVSNIINLVICMLLRNTTIITEFGKAKDNQVEEKKGLNYVINIIQKSPTLFVGGTEETLQTLQKRPSYQDTEIEAQQECTVCCSNPSTCVIMPCMHSGICKLCAKQCLIKKSTCLFCRQNIEKIVIVEKKSSTEYVVKEELTAH